MCIFWYQLNKIKQNNTIELCNDKRHYYITIQIMYCVMSNRIMKHEFSLGAKLIKKKHGEKRKKRRKKKHCHKRMRNSVLFVQWVDCPIKTV